MNSLSPKTYEAALERANSKPIKPRQSLSRSKKGLVRSPIRTKGQPAGTQGAGTKALRPTRKSKRKKQLSTGQWKKKAWVQFSIFIRTRGADSEGLNLCFTCDIRLHWKRLEAGHLVPGRGNAVLFNEIGVNPQCRRCNGHFRGNTIVYYPKMVVLHGQQVVDELIAAKDATHKWLPDELEEIYTRYKTLNDANPLLN